ncbi:MAG TPA: DUF1552 domain-containing protein [Polyangiaceae bacterium]|nr:DUF1552 domain-containing protein [Polyangiaceae bacterium]
MSRSPRISRRLALTALGAGASYALTLPGQHSARAAEGRPKYFIGIYMPHGVARELWVPRAGFDITYANCSLEPFADTKSFGQSFREQILTIEGLDLSAGMAGGTVGHDGSRALLTGSASNGRNASIDQFLALEQGLGQGMPLSSLVLGVGSPNPALGWCISYAQGGSALPKIVDPTATFQQAFAQWVVGDDPIALAKAAAERKRGKSLIDYWRVELAALTARAPQSERDKLEQHATALRDLEQRLDGELSACTPPTAPDPATFPSVRAYQGGEPYFDIVTNLQVDLIAHALACGVTRVATLFLNDLSRTHLDPTLPDDVHIDVAHRYETAGRAGQGGSPATWLTLARQNRYTYSKIARLLQRLAERQLLQDTVLVAMSDMGDPARHSSRQIPALLAGGWGGRLKAGRHLDLGASGTPNNRLLVSIQQAFGTESESFGQTSDPAIVTGKLDLS